MNAPIIDTVQALEAAHKLFEHAFKIGQETEYGIRLLRIADSGFSAVVPYLRNRSTPVQRKHADSINIMLQEADKI